MTLHVEGASLRDEVEAEEGSADTTKVLGDTVTTASSPFSLENVAHILGMSVANVHLLVAEGRLELDWSTEAVAIEPESLSRVKRLLDAFTLSLRTRLDLERALGDTESEEFLTWLQSNVPAYFPAFLTLASEDGDLEWQSEILASLVDLSLGRIVEIDLDALDELWGETEA